MSNYLLLGIVRHLLQLYLCMLKLRKECNLLEMSVG